MGNLDISKFEALQSFYLKHDLEFILTSIYNAYLLMLVEYTHLENNENKIRNRLYKDFLKPVHIKEKLGLSNFIFHPEIHEINEHYDEFARTDLMCYSPTEYLKNENAYYVIECKRLDGTNTLNGKYVIEGIDRFVNEKYTSHFSTNAMLGFIVNNIDIGANTMNINGLQEYAFIEDFQFSYMSNHTTVNSQKDFSLYHLMLDFSSKIYPISY